MVQSVEGFSESKARNRNVTATGCKCKRTNPADNVNCKYESYRKLIMTQSVQQGCAIHLLSLGKMQCKNWCQQPGFDKFFEMHVPNVPFRFLSLPLQTSSMTAVTATAVSALKVLQGLGMFGLPNQTVRRCQLVWRCLEHFSICKLTEVPLTEPLKPETLAHTSISGMPTAFDAFYQMSSNITKILHNIVYYIYKYWFLISQAICQSGQWFLFISIV